MLFEGTFQVESQELDDALERLSDEISTVRELVEALQENLEEWKNLLDKTRAGVR